MHQATSGKQAFALSGLIAVTAIWGLTFILVKWTVEDLGIYFFLFVRFSLASTLLIAIFRRRLKRIEARTVKAACILGLLMFTVYAAQTEGLRITTASNSALITGLYMVLVPLMVLIYPGKKPDPLAVVGIAIALPGLFLLTRFSPTGINAGDLITLICTLACACHIVLTGEFANQHSLIPLVVIQFLFVTLMSGIVATIKGEFTTEISYLGWSTIAITAVLGTAVAFTIQIAAQRIVDPTRAGIALAMEAVFGALFGFLIGGETMTALSFVGACLMVSGMFISEMRPLVKFAIDKVVG